LISDEIKRASSNAWLAFNLGSQCVWYLEDNLKG
jgi:hypothetical protein